MDPPAVGHLPTPAGPAVVGVLIPTPLPQLDRAFDYAVPDDLRSAVSFGVRVRVRFAGRLATGFVVEIKDDSDFKLQPIRSVLGPSVLTPELLALSRAVAERWVGTLGDVLTAAVPPRHVRAERAVCGSESQLPAPLPPAPACAGPAPSWPAWTHTCERLTGGVGSAARPERPAGPEGPEGPADQQAARAPMRAAVTIPWGWDEGPVLASAVAAVLASGRRVLIVVPNDDDIARVRAGLRLINPSPRVVTLTSTAGPQARYGAYLRALSGQADVVVGTRSAAFVPVPDLGLIWLWRDSDPSMPDPQAPYWHPREVTGMRSAAEQVPWIAAARTRSTDVQRLVEVGWAREVTPSRPAWRSGAATVRAVSEADTARDAAAQFARLPKAAFEVARAGLHGVPELDRTPGPVLVQVPRRGYLPAVACTRCRELARCPRCEGALTLPARGGAPVCRRCGASAPDWTCVVCGGHRLRAVRIGSGRTAEELAQAFPQVTVRTSDAEVGVLEAVADVPCLVVATPGAEPRVVSGRYRAALLLDGDAMLAVPRLRAAEDAVARWCDAAAMVDAGGTVLLVAASQSSPVQAMVRADPVGWASRELAERTAARLPPAVRMIALEGASESVSEVLAELERGWPPGVPALDPLGPVPLPPSPGRNSGRGRGAGSEGAVAELALRWLLGLTYAEAPRVAEALSQIQRERGRLRAPVVTVRVDPHDID